MPKTTGPNAWNWPRWLNAEWLRLRPDNDLEYGLSVAGGFILVPSWTLDLPRHKMQVGQRYNNPIPRDERRIPASRQDPKCT